MKKQIIFMAMAMMLYAISGFGQTTATLLDHGLSSADHVMYASTWDQMEPSIAIDKNNFPNMIVTFTTCYYDNQNDGSGTNFSGYYTSPDFGVTVSGMTASMPNSAQSYGSVSTCFDNASNGFIMGRNGDFTGFFNVISPSASDGVSWSMTTTNTSETSSSSPFGYVMGKADDQPGSPFVNNYYSAWQVPSSSGLGSVIKTATSTDHGGSFGSSVPLSTNYAGAPNIQTGPGGEVYVCWANLGYLQTMHSGIPTYTDNNPLYPAYSIGFASSTDGGSYTSNDSLIRYEQMIGNDETGGNLTLGDATYGLTDVTGNPVMGVDKSCGVNRGVIYIAAPLQGSGTTSGIGLWTSSNQGSSFTFASIISSSAGQSNCWSPWIAVDDVTGIVSVVYFGYASGDPSTTNTWVAFFNPSDPSPTWANIQVSSGTQTPYPFSLGHDLLGDPVPLSNLFVEGFEGYYIGIDAYMGHAFPVWKDRRGSRRQIWIADIQYNNAPMTFSSIGTQDICDPTAPITKLGTQTFEASDHINIATCGETVSIGSLTSPAKVYTIAGQSIVIGQGFVTAPGSVFTAEIATTSGCQTPGVQSFKTNPPSTTSSDIPNAATDVNGLKVYAYPNPTTNLVTVGTSNNNYRNVSFIVTDISGRQMAQYDNPTMSDAGIRQIIDATSYAQGLYIVTMTADNQKYSFKFAKE